MAQVVALEKIFFSNFFLIQIWENPIVSLTHSELMQISIFSDFSTNYNMKSMLPYVGKCLSF